MASFSLRTLRSKAKFLVWLLTINASSGVLLQASQEKPHEKIIASHEKKHDQKIDIRNDLTHNDVLSIVESKDTLVCLGETGQKIFRSLYNSPAQKTHSDLLKNCCKRVHDGYATVSYKDVLRVAEELCTVLANQEDQPEKQPEKHIEAKKNLEYIQALVEASELYALAFTSDKPESINVTLSRDGNVITKSGACCTLYLAPDAHVAHTFDVVSTVGSANQELLDIDEVLTRIVTPKQNLSTLLISTVVPYPLTPAGLALSPAAAGNSENGKLVVAGNELVNNMSPWKTGTIVNQNGVPTFMPLQTGQKAASADNYFPDPTGTTTLNGNFTITGDLTIGGSTNLFNKSFTFSSDVFIANGHTLFVSEIDPKSPSITTSFSGNVYIMNGKDLAVSGSTKLHGTLNVDQTAVFNSTILVNEINPLNLSTGLEDDRLTTSFSGQVSITGTTMLSRQLFVDGDVMFFAGLDVAGSTTLESTLDVYKDTILHQDLFVTGLATLGSLDVLGSSTLEGTLDVYKDTILHQDLLVTGTAVLGGLDVTGSTTLQGTLDVYKDVILHSDLLLNGTAVLGGLDVTGSTTLQGTLDVYKNTLLHESLGVFGLATVGQLDVVGSTTLEGTLNVNKTAVFNGTILVNEINPLNLSTGLEDDRLTTSFSGQVSITGTTMISQQLFVNDDVTFYRNLDVKGSTTLEGTLNVNKTAVFNGTILVNEINPLNLSTGLEDDRLTTSFSGQVSITGTTMISQQLFVNDDVTFYRNLDVKGSTTLEGTLNVNKTAVFNGTILVNEINPLNLSTGLEDDRLTTSFSGQVSITGTTMISQQLFVNDDVTFYRNLDVKGSTTLEGTLNVGETAVFNGTILVNEINPLNLGTGLEDDRLTTSLSGQVSITGTTQLSRPLFAYDDVTFYRNFDVKESTTLEGTLNVNKTAVFNGTILVNEINPLNLGTGLEDDRLTTSFSGQVSITGTTQLSRPLFAYDDVTFYRNFDVKGSTTLEGTLNVNKTAVFNGTILVNEINPLNLGTGLEDDRLTTSFSGQVSITGTTILSRPLFVDSNVQFYRNLDVAGSTTLQGTLNVNKTAIFNGHILVDQIDPINLNTGLEDDRLTTSFSGQVSITGTTILSRPLFVDSNVQFYRNLDVAGSTTLQGTLNVNKTAIFNGHILVDQIDPINLNTGLEDDRLTTSLSGQVSITGTTMLSRPLFVNGNVTFFRNLDVKGSTTLESTLDVNKNVILHQALLVTGTATLGGLDVTGSTTLEGTLTLNKEVFMCTRPLFVNRINPCSPTTTTTFGGSINLPNTTTANIGSLQIGGARFINNFGSQNNFVGTGAGNITLTGANNTALGYQSLLADTTGANNTGLGSISLQANTTGNNNTAVGQSSLAINTIGASNTAVGQSSLAGNISGGNNTAVGYQSLLVNTSNNNTAVGQTSLNSNTAGSGNTAIGQASLLSLVSGTGNIAVGSGAGSSYSLAESNNIVLGASGSSGESNVIRVGTTGTQTTCLVAGIFGTTVSVGTGIPVVVDSTGKLGTIVSSQKYKEDINDMKTQSENLLKLRPVSFKYKKDIDPTGLQQFGLIAEEVAKVAPELVVYSPKDGTPETVRYHLLTPMLLNEYQKQAEQLTAHDAKLKGQHDELEKMRTRLQALEQSLQNK